MINFYTDFLVHASISQVWHSHLEGSPKPQLIGEIVLQELEYIPYTFRKLQLITTRLRRGRQQNLRQFCQTHDSPILARSRTGRRVPYLQRITGDRKQIHQNHPPNHLPHRNPILNPAPSHQVSNAKTR